ncbi:hypothetical protein ANN_01766 [Periplaneta americana]|uniref:Uncharacterized protein n=1 Tax=Periplaneta americana TaxID=6978 RepID=A0ABQ8TWU5_PERAM|nr:hypothetical protein ANN_01766 [Periplaneta americana]
MGWACSTYGSRNAYRVLVGRPEGKRSLGRPRRRWEDNIKMDLRKVGYDDREWINLAHDRDRWRAYVRAAMNLRFGGSLNTHRFMTSYTNNSDNSILSPRPNIAQLPQSCDLRNYAVKLTGFLKFGKDAATLPPRGFDGHLSILLNEDCDWLLTGEDKISVTGSIWFYSFGSETVSTKVSKSAVPPQNTFTSIHRRLCEQGSFDRRTEDQGRRCSVQTPETEEAVLRFVENSPSVNTKAIAHQFNNSHCTAWRILQEQLLHPYYLAKVHATKTEEKLDEIGERLEHTPQKSLKRLAQETGIFQSSAKNATKLLKLGSTEPLTLCDFYGDIKRVLFIRLSEDVSWMWRQMAIFSNDCEHGDNAGEMSPESNTESYPAFAHIGLRENPGKNLNQSLMLAGNEFQSLVRIGSRENPGKKPQPGNLPRPGFEPGPPGFADFYYYVPNYAFRSVLTWLFNDAASTTRLFSVDEIGDSEMVFDEMRPRIRHILPGIHITIGENLGKKPTRSLYRRPPESADSLDRPPWNVRVVQRCWMTSAMALEADLLGGRVSSRTDRMALEEFSEAGMIYRFCRL